MSIKIIPTTDRLYYHYDGQCNPQDCYIEVDYENNDISASYNSEIGNAVPSRVWHGHAERFQIPCLTTAAADGLIEDLAPIAERIIAGYESVWDGNNYTAKFTDEAEAAKVELQQHINNCYFDESDLDSGDEPEEE